MYTVKKYAHLVAGLLMLFMTFEELEANNLRATFGYAVLAILCLIVAGTYKNFEKKFDKGDFAFLLAEALALFYISWNYNEQDKTIHSWVFGILSAGFAFLAFHSLIITTKPKKKKRKKRRSSSEERKAESLKEEALRNTPSS